MKHVELAMTVENMFLGDSTFGLTNLLTSSLWRIVLTEHDAKTTQEQSIMHPDQSVHCACPSAWCQARRRSRRTERPSTALIFVDVLSRPTQSTSEVMKPIIIAEQESIR